MTILTQSSTPVNPIESLLDQIGARGFDRAAVRQCLLDGVSIRPLYYDAQGNGNFEATVIRRDLLRSCDVQLTIGPSEKSVGCVSCARDKAGPLHYFARLDTTCPAVGATMLKVIISRNYAAEFEAWQRAGWDAERIFAKTGPGRFEVRDPLPAPLSPAAMVAAGLSAEYPEHAKRIAAALELVESDRLDLAKYETTWDNAGFLGCWSCTCPDARHRGDALRTRWGIFCKHAIGGLIEQLVQKEAWRIATQKLASDLERSRQILTVEVQL
jgi:hypothetical protein